MKTIKSQNTDKKKTITQYVSLKINKKQCIENNMTMEPYYGGMSFNKTYTYSSCGFCTRAEANMFYDKLDFHKFQEVLNFLNKNWGWKVLSIVPVMDAEINSSSIDHYYTEFSKSFLYTFYRDIEVEDE